MDKNTEKTRKTEPDDNPETIEVKDKNQDPKLNIDNDGVSGKAFDFQRDIQ